MAEVKIEITAHDRASSAVREIASGFDKCKSAAMDFFKALVGFSAFDRIVGTAVNSVKSLAMSFIDISTQNEAYKATLTTLLGSQEAANRKFAELNEFARKTPFQIEQLMQSFIMLKSYGLDPSIRTMEILGDTTAALGGGSAKMEGIARALGQIATKGKLSAQEMMQLAEQGVPAYQILKEKIGITAQQLENLGASGVSANKAIEAILEGLDERFGGQMQNMQGTWKGVVEEIKSLWRDFVSMVADAGVFDKLKSAVKDLRDWLTEAFKTGKVKEWADSISSAVGTVIDALKVLKDVLVTVAKHMDDIVVGLSAMALSRAATAISGITLSFAGLGAAIAAAGTALKGFLPALVAITAYEVGSWIDSFFDLSGKKKYEQEMKRLAEAQKKYNEAIKLRNQKIEEQRQSEIKAAEASAANKQEIEATVKALSGASKAISQYGADMLKFAGQDFSAGKKSIEEYLKLIDNVANQQISMQSKIKEAMRSAGASPQEITQQQAAILETEKRGAEARLQVWEQYYASLKQKQQELFSIQMNTQDMLLSLEQKTMAPREKYFSQVQRLEEKERMAMSLNSAEKINLLKQVQQAWMSLTDEVKEGDTVYLSQAQAISEAKLKISSIGSELEAETKKQLESQSSAFTSIENAMAKSQEMIEHYRSQIAGLGDEIIKIQANAALEIKVENSAAKSALNEIRDAFNNLKSFIESSKIKATVEAYTKASPERPFTEGIEYMKGKLNELSGKADYVMDLSQLSSAITVYTGLVEKLHAADFFGLKSTGAWRNTFAQIYSEPVSMMKQAIEKSLNPEGSYDAGTSYVPKTGIYKLHQGEMVFNRRESANYDQRRYSSNITFSPNITIKGGDKDARQIAREIVKPLQEEMRRMQAYN